MNPTQLICDIGELNHLFKNSMSIEHFLQQTVAMVSKHLHCNVCSIYIYDEDEKLLTLKATQGLNPKAANTVQLQLGQGLVGKALKELRTLNIEDASNHPDFKAFAGIEEEKYQNFLAIPIARGHNRIGVLSLQRISAQKFTAEQEVACKAVASQLANIIENAKFLISIHSQTQPKHADKDEEKIEGLPLPPSHPKDERTHLSLLSFGLAFPRLPGQYTGIGGSRLRRPDDPKAPVHHGAQGEEGDVARANPLQTRRRSFWYMPEVARGQGNHQLERTRNIHLWTKQAACQKHAQAHCSRS